MSGDRLDKVPYCGVSTITQNCTEMTGYGAAIDLGTTEVRVSLWDLAGKQCIGRRSLRNPQAEFGADVLSRLTAASESAASAGELSGSARETIGLLIRGLCTDHAVSVSDIRKVSVVGNTAMLALLTGQGYDALLRPGMWNQVIECRFPDLQGIRENWGVNSACRIEVVQPMAGFVGSDLYAGIIATGLAGGQVGSLLLDFGANTEIALWDGSRLWATSAAGGPAFEGSGIRCGMAAEPGAICRVQCDPVHSVFIPDVIGGGAPEGICGSGLIDISACMLRSGLLSESGRLKGDAGKKGFVPISKEENIIVTAQDIDALQRAKAGVSASAQCLIRKAGLRLSEIRRVCVSGAFGSYLDAANAIAIGLLPPVDLQHVELCGNTALAGAEKLLTECRNPGASGGPHKGSVVINMSYLPEYEDVFIRDLRLRPWSGDSEATG
ncbi:MAG: DUF4445 domain-containing protein [Nitrospirae bacterium]|nr:DUF4445 domain-containing protein [Nitrospirota bacterium]